MQVNNQIWVIGGSKETEVCTDTVHVLDLSTCEWHKPAVSGKPGLLTRCAHTAVLHPKKPGHILLFGGTTGCV